MTNLPDNLLLLIACYVLGEADALIGHVLNAIYEAN